MIGTNNGVAKGVANGVVQSTETDFSYKHFNLQKTDVVVIVFVFNMYKLRK